jgi:ankyrin repeat protein
LLDNGADTDTLACCGASALHFSSESGNLPIVQELVEHGHAR